MLQIGDGCVCFSPSAIVCQLSGRDAPRPTMTGASGYASFEFINNGKIHYQVIKNKLQYYYFETFWLQNFST